MAKVDSDPTFVLTLFGLGIAIALAMPRAHAAGDALVAVGACRDGLPNGAYELRMPDGRLRVLGAFHAGKRTGSFIFWNAWGGRLAVIPYDEDVRNGTIALWHVGGAAPRELSRRLEAPVAAGQAHGARRSWHANGRPRVEAQYDHNRLVGVAAWDASGRRFAEREARRRAAEDLRVEGAYLATLERLVTEHQPACD